MITRLIVLSALLGDRLFVAGLQSVRFFRLRLASEWTHFNTVTVD